MTKSKSKLYPLSLQSQLNLFKSYSSTQYPIHNHNTYTLTYTGGQPRANSLARETDGKAKETSEKRQVTSERESEREKKEERERGTHLISPAPGWPTRS